MSNVEIRVAFQNLTQIVTTQSQVVITQAQAMTAQANREAVSRVNQQVATMNSHLRDFTRMHPSDFYGSMV